MKCVPKNQIFKILPSIFDISDNNQDKKIKEEKE